MRPAPKTTSSDAYSTSLQVDFRTLARAIEAWGIKNFFGYPWRSGNQGWHGLLAELLLQRTRAASVVPVYNAFVQRYPSPTDLAAAPVEDVAELMYPLGLRWRAPLVRELGRALAGYGDIPDDYDRLRELHLLP